MYCVCSQYLHVSTFFLWVPGYLNQVSKIIKKSKVTVLLYCWNKPGPCIVFFWLWRCKSRNMDRGTSWRWQRAEAGVGVHRQEHSKTSNGLTLTNCSRLTFLFGILVCRINKEQRYLVSYKTSKVFRIHIHAIFKCKKWEQNIFFAFI